MTITSNKQKGRKNGTQKKTVTFEDQEKECEKFERNLEQQYWSGEKDDEESRRVHEQNPGQGSLSGESDVEEIVHGQEKDLKYKILSGEFKFMSRARITDPKERTRSIADSSVVDNFQNSGIGHY